VRVAIVRALVELSAQDPGKTRAVLAAQLDSEREAPVLAAIADALPPGRYGAAELRSLRDGEAPVVAKGHEAIVLRLPAGKARVLLRPTPRSL
jgi:hypothetical protein